MLSFVQNTIGWVSGCILVCAFFPYWKSIRADIGTKPNQVTWLVWAVGDAIGLIGQIADHTATIILAVAVLCALYTFTLSLKYGESEWTITHWVCLGLSGVALLMWGVMHLVHSTHAPDYAIAFSMLSLGCGAWPTWEKSWFYPASEDKRSWQIFVLSSFLAIFAITSATFAKIIVPVTFFFIDSVVLGIITLRPRTLARPAGDNAGIYC